jgi:transcriptional regulator GlxA family with amidase domain
LCQKGAAAVAESDRSAITAAILALPQTAGSGLYGMVDVLAATGTLWQELVGEPPGRSLIRPVIVGRSRDPFRCGNGIPVAPETAIGDDFAPDIVIVPEIWLAPDDDLKGQFPDVTDWIRARHRAGSVIYSACSGAVLLAATGLLDGRPATSHWGYGDLFHRSYPSVDFQQAPSLIAADAKASVVTAGGTTSWHDLAIHIIARHCSTGDALRIAKVYLLKQHDEGQLPYTPLVRRQPHADAAVREAENWLAAHFREPNAVAGVAAASRLPDRSLKRRFKAATGTTLINYVQNLRIEEAKALLEAGVMPAEDISIEVGYENHAFFRRLFKRSTGLTPGQYRRMFQPFMNMGEPAETPPAVA